MKIQFLIGNPTDPWTPPTKAVDNWNEFTKESNQQEYCDPDIFQIVKTLELSKKFEEALIMARIALNIPPDGLDFNTFVSHRFLHKDDEAFIKNEDNVGEWIKTKWWNIYILSTNFNIDYRIKDQLDNLIYGNFIFPYHQKITRELVVCNEDVDEIEYDMLQITITGQVSKNELQNYIEKEWSSIQRDLQNLPVSIKSKLTPRDCRIIELRDQEHKPYREIADSIINEFGVDNIEGQINEDSIKQAYIRAKEKIHNLNKPIK